MTSFTGYFFCLGGVQLKTICYPTVFSGVYCYMKLQGYRRLVNVTMIYYTINLLSLLIDAYMQLYGYATAMYSDDTAMTVELSIQQYILFY